MAEDYRQIEMIDAIIYGKVLAVAGVVVAVIAVWIMQVFYDDDMSAYVVVGVAVALGGGVCAAVGGVTLMILWGAK